MSIFKKFPSIAFPDKYGYIYDSEAWHSKALFNMHYLMFETYGHGITQHSHEWPIGYEFAADYLMSLAAAMFADDELAKEVQWRFPISPKVEKIAFAASIKYDGSTPDVWGRYYSLELMKVTKSKAKEHDKRYSQIRSFHDGSAKSIFDILSADSGYQRGLEQFMLADAIRQWLRSPKGGYSDMPSTTEFLGWSNESDSNVAEYKSSDIRCGIEQVQSMAEAYRLRHNAKRQLECYKSNLESASTAANKVA